MENCIVVKINQFAVYVHDTVVPYMHDITKIYFSFFFPLLLHISFVISRDLNHTNF